MYITISLIWKFIVLSFSIFYFWIYKYRSISFIFVESIRCRTLRISVIVRKWRKHMNKWEKSVLQRCCVLPNWSGENIYWRESSKISTLMGIVLAPEMIEHLQPCLLQRSLPFLILQDSKIPLHRHWMKLLLTRLNSFRFWSCNY